MSHVSRALAAAMLLAILVLPGVALAHEHREVGKYEFSVGWAVEPAFVGEKNGIELRVTHKAESGTGAAAEGPKPVEGLEKTLKAEVIFGGQKREVDLRPVFRQPGRYTTDLVPTKEGDYRFRFFGAIEGTPVNETFDSADGKFNSVKSIQPLQFPEPVPAIGQVNQTAQAANQTAQAAGQKALAAQQAAATNQTLAIAGTAAGALGILLGGLALVVGGRRARVAERPALGGRLGEEPRS